MFEWHKKSKLAEQLKFFGAKKQGFISVYAKKPRILVKPKVDDRALINLGQWSAESYLYNAHIDRQMSMNRQVALSNLAARGMQNVGMGGYASAGITQSQLAANYGRQQAQGCFNNNKGN
tara:strand:+ start:219 stop:578 length:360 start_codon:yes stop_codon:yes gene_type:complete